MSDPEWPPALAARRDELRAARRPAVAIRSTPAPESAFRSGASRIGGRPDLPAGTPWPVAVVGREPRSTEFALAFVAQINLADVARHLEELPASGLLSFFVLDELRLYRALGRATSEVPRSERVRVLFTPPKSARTRLDPPAGLPAGHVAATRKPAFRRSETWPQVEGTCIGDRGAKRRAGEIFLSAAQWQAWAECAPANPPSQMLGHPCGCEYPVGREPGARLLLALDVKDAGLPWDFCGRNGHLFFGIPGDALAAQSWERVYHKEW